MKRKVFVALIFRTKTPHVLLHRLSLYLQTIDISSKPDTISLNAFNQSFSFWTNYITIQSAKSCSSINESLYPELFLKSISQGW